MIIFKEASPLSSQVKHEKNQGQKVGFVPTMGALHKGHLTLIEASKRENDLTICSIFVNPTQFNNPEDFKHYPVTIEKDIQQLIENGCDILFLPSVEEIYPSDFEKQYYDLGELEFVLEGEYRPGHFQGVCQVVDRLLQITQPNNLYMGQKDFQQCMVVQKLLELTGKDDEIAMKIIPTIREADGLAMSSRNLRLSSEQRELSTVLYQQLLSIKNSLNTSAFPDLKQKAKAALEQKGFKVDYIEIAEASTLQPASENGENLVALVAATIGNIRLIDNMLLD
jgi:pantoate--beta-alanine ligase